jgi:hypothetical protein
MGIDIHWDNERGERLAELGDSAYLVHRFLPPYDAKEFPCLRFVDPAGDTVFNQAQISELIWELERLAAQKYKHEPRVEAHLRAVLKFVQQAEGKTHTYIKFCGD